MKISEHGTCVQESECLPTKFNPVHRNVSRQTKQKEFIDKYDCFLSGGRLYVKLKSYIVDVVTGTLFALTGHSVSHEADLYVDINDVNRDKSVIEKFVLGKY